MVTRRLLEAMWESGVGGACRPEDFPTIPRFRQKKSCRSTQSARQPAVEEDKINLTFPESLRYLFR